MHAQATSSFLADYENHNRFCKRIAKRASHAIDVKRGREKRTDLRCGPEWTIPWGGACQIESARTAPEVHRPRRRWREISWTCNRAAKPWVDPCRWCDPRACACSLQRQETSSNWSASQHALLLLLNVQARESYRVAKFVSWFRDALRGIPECSSTLFDIRRRS